MQTTSGLSDSGVFILRWQAVGFSLLLLIMCAVEALRLPHLFFGESSEFMWPRLLARSTALAVAWLIVHLSTRRLLQRLHQLEKFLLICSWCRRVGHQGNWLTTEDYFSSRFSTETSHGICPGCAEQQFTQLKVTRVSRPAAQ